MKKKLFVIALAVGLLAANFTVISTASALSVDKCDEVFAQALSEFMADEGYGSQTIAADKQIVYDMGLEELGVLYTFTAGGEDGYAVVVDSTEGCTLSECFFGAENPYSGVEGTKVYAGPMIYLGYEDGEYTLGGEALSDEEVADIADTAYAASGSFTTSSETVYYTYRSYDGYSIVSRPPRYRSRSGIRMRADSRRKYRWILRQILYKSYSQLYSRRFCRQRFVYVFFPKR